ncbi:glycoside hydrolase family 3 protein [Actinopolymorpha sp. B9G3]|uniref:glycoside hydrolase family 3 protein n=1 Tax=Actinopolymorpha sp. B9G3 TaxID=3158970 RepID=UPI0032D8F7EF
MSVRQKVGQLFVTRVYGSAPDTVDSRNTADFGVPTPADVVEKYDLGGICYFTVTDNVVDPPQVARLSNGLQRVAVASGAELPLLISTDQEGGTIVRIGPPATQFAGNMALGASRDVKAARDTAAILGQELRAIGINQDNAPVADVNINPANPVIGVRSFGADPNLVSRMTAAQVKGFQRDAKILATAKHFPGHGDTAVDSHTGIPIITHSREQWEAIDAPPFKAAIRAGVGAIMTGHLVFPALDPSGDPATLSYPIMTGILRQELGFDGLVTTDALDMQGVRDKYGDDRVPVLALKAGVDLLLLPPKFDLAYDAVLEAVDNGEISENRLNESVRRILTWKYTSGLVRNPYVDVDRVPSIVGTPGHLARADQITNKTTTLIKNDASVLPLSLRQGSTAFVCGNGTGTQGLADEFENRNVSTIPLNTGTQPTDADIETAVGQARIADVTVVLTQRAWDTNNTDPQQRQQLLVERLLATGKPIVVVAIRDPYDIAHFTDVQTFLATYIGNTVAMRACAKVLFGEVDPTAKLPVAIPSVTEPGKTLYPLGWGLSY